MRRALMFAAVVSALLASNIQRVHQELSAHVNTASASIIDVSTVDRYQSLGEAGLRMIDAEVNRQAAMVAYIDDFYLMMWLTLAVTPFVLLMRKSGTTPARS